MRLLDANHIPGSCQVLVEYGGRRLLYSGDFDYPAASPPKCDYLVLDATHGDPAYSYETDRSGTMRQMRERILAETQGGRSVVVRSSRGTLQEIIRYLESGERRVPDGVRFIAGRREIDVLHAIYPSETPRMRGIIERGSIEAYEAVLDGGPCVMFAPGLVPDEDTGSWFSVYVDRYRWFGDGTPGLLEMDGGIRCNLSSHASYSNIMRFVRDVNPEFVLTDSSRSSCASMLAERIREDLHIDAAASEQASE